MNNENSRASSKGNLKAELLRVSNETGSAFGHVRTKELHHLASCLLDNENVVALSVGRIGNKRCLVAVTSRRLLIVRVGFLSGVEETEFSLNDVIGVDVRTGLVRAKIAVKTSNDKLHIDNLTKSAARFIAQKIREGYQSEARSPATDKQIFPVAPSTPKQTVVMSGRARAVRFMWLGLLGLLGGWGILSWASDHHTSTSAPAENRVSDKPTPDSSAKDKAAGTTSKEPIAQGGDALNPQVAIHAVEQLPEGASKEKPPAVNSSSALGLYYVISNSLNERAAPSLDSKILNVIYRGEGVTVTEVRGEWVRITEQGLQLVGGHLTSWVNLKFLSRERPKPLPQPIIPENYQDSRIKNLPKVGENGLAEADVLSLWKGAKAVLERGLCIQIVGGDKSVHVKDMFYVNCDQIQSIFFKLSKDEILICGLGSSDCESPMPRKTANEMHNIMAIFVAIGQGVVKARLRDPDSVQWGKIWFSWGVGGVAMVCGEVSAKNGFGGYTGMQKFISAGTTKFTFLQSDVRDFSNLWAEMCGKKYNKVAVSIWGPAADIAPTRFR